MLRSATRIARSINAPIKRNAGGLAQAYDKAPKVQHKTATANPFAAQVTTLGNGLTVVTQENIDAVSTVSIVVNAGSRFQTPANAGVAHLVQRLFYGNTFFITETKLLSALQHTGANISASATRENIVYSAEGLREHTGNIASLMLQSIVSPRLHDIDIKAKLPQVEMDIQALAASPETMVMEGVHTSAFNNNTLGLPLVCPPHNLSKIKKEDVVTFMNTYFAPARTVLVGANFDHAHLVSVAQEIMGHVSASAPVAPTASVYTGGESRMNVAKPAVGESDTHVAVAFKGADFNHVADVAALEVLKAMLGGFSSDYTTTTTTGVQSRLGQNVADKFSGVSKISVFNTNYSDAGLFGVYFATCPLTAESVTKAVVAELKNATTSVSEEQVAIAKRLAKVSQLSALESGLNRAELLARQVKRHSSYNEQNGAELLAAIDAVKAADVKRVASNLLASKVALSAYGVLDNVPSVQDIAAQL